jgi:hypothetical protein
MEAAVGVVALHLEQAQFQVLLFAAASALLARTHGPAELRTDRLPFLVTFYFLLFLYFVLTAYLLIHYPLTSIQK